MDGSVAERRDVVATRREAHHRDRAGELAKDPEAQLLKLDPDPKNNMLPRSCVGHGCGNFDLAHHSAHGENLHRAVRPEHAGAVGDDRESPSDLSEPQAAPQPQEPHQEQQRLEKREMGFPIDHHH